MKKRIFMAYLDCKDICICQKMNAEQIKIYVVEKHIKDQCSWQLPSGLED